MSYSINEGLDDQRRKLRAMRAVEKRYPEATMSHGRWYASGVGEDATDVTTLNDDDCKRGDKILAAVANVEEIYVFDHWALMSVTELLYTLKKEHPEAYATIVDVVARRKPAAR